MESLKKFEEICQNDPRQDSFVYIDPTQPEGFRRKTLADFYCVAENIRLHEGVPEDIRNHFETARNLIIYSWFFYPLNVTAQLSAYITAEFALRVKTGNQRKSFSSLLKTAVESGWITDEGFSHIRRRRKALREYNEGMPSKLKIPESNAIAEYSNNLVECIPSLRNTLAHGSSFLHHGGAMGVRICADLINQLFPKPDEQQQK